MSKLIILPFFCLIIFAISCESNTYGENPVTAADSTVVIDHPVKASSFTVFRSKEGKLDTILNLYSEHFEPVVLYSEDSLELYGNYYHAADDAKSILLCHQARWSKFEYDSSAVALKEMGFNCFAIDQRSGGTIPLGGKDIGPINQTYLNAIKANKGTDYLDAQQDIRTAINYLYQRNGKKPIVLWGSSYSSTLALYLGIDNEKVAAMVCFSPGNYFADTLGSLVPMLKMTEKPFFLTSSKEEAPELAKLIKGKKLTNNQIQFVPKEAGHHGSRALWLTKSGNEEYWEAINTYLKQIK